MTPEREAEIRRIIADEEPRENSCFYEREILAELDALRAKVGALDVYVTKSYEWWSGASAKADGFGATLIKGRELGLFTEPEPDGVD